MDNELLATAVEGVMLEWAAALDKLWQRADAPWLMSGYLDGRIVFTFTADGIQIEERIRDAD
jgi:hypothetical protein